MSMVLSLINNAISISTKVKEEKHREAREKRKVEFEKMQNPIEPPEFWKTLKERNEKAPTGPYSTTSIRRQLKNDIIPSGYALDQLQDVGFFNEVRDFQARMDKRRDDTKTALKDQVRAIIDELNKTLADRGSPELERQAQLYEQSNMGDLIDEGRNLIGKLNDGTANEGNVDEYINTLKLKLDGINLTIQDDQQSAGRTKLLTKARDTRDAKLMQSMQHSIIADLRDSNVLPTAPT